jgi:mediator of RNA polymerase II transcription subunit 11
LEQEIQTTLHEEIKSASGYHPFDKCDYSATIANEICCKKLEYVSVKMGALQLNIEQSTNEV